jgi:hypothetical protein
MGAFDAAAHRHGVARDLPARPVAAAERALLDDTDQILAAGVDVVPVALKSLEPELQASDLLLIGRRLLREDA